MQNNKLRMAIRATAAVTVLGLASQAQAFSFSAGDVDADVYGYVRANFSYDMDEEVADNTASGSFPTIGANNVAEGHFNASASQSRIGVKATNSDGVMINVEGDFYTTAGRDQLRLRHAYGSYKGILAGQTWSNFTSFAGLTPSVDFSGAAGLPGLQGRATQLRYTTGPMSFSIEEPFGGISNRTDEKDGLPALTARLEDNAGNLSYSAAALVKQTEYDDGNNSDDSAMGYAVFGAGKVKLTDMISIQGSMTYTDGANSYNFRSGADDAFDDGTGSLDTISSMGGVIGTSIGLGQGRSINIQHGMVENDTDDVAGTETNQTTFVNYMWKPADSVTMGAEYQYWKTEDESGDSADANRVMFMAQYNF